MSENPAMGTVDLDLDGPRKLMFTFDSIRLIEKECGLNFLLPTMEERAAILRPNMTLLAAMLAGELLHEDPSMTVSQAGRLIVEHGKGDVFEKVMEAYSLGMGQKQNGKGATPDPQSRPDGSTSGHSASSSSAGATSGSSRQRSSTPSSSSTSGEIGVAGKRRTTGARSSRRSK